MLSPIANSEGSKRLLLATMQFWGLIRLVVIGCSMGVFCLGVLLLVHHASYVWLKGRIVERRRWGLNICCGETDGGGANADIVQHADVPTFVLIQDIYHLPFEDGQFDTVLCSHTLEHVDEPRQFWEELQRVGREVTLVVPPL